MEKVKKARLKLNDKRKYMGVYVDKDIYDNLMQKAYSKGETLSEFVRDLLWEAINAE